MVGGKSTQRVKRNYCIGVKNNYGISQEPMVQLSLNINALVQMSSTKSLSYCCTFPGKVMPEHIKVEWINRGVHKQKHYHTAVTIQL
jgi:hypothetical protein